MIKLTVLYPNGADTKFDMAYYTSKHLPMVKQKCGPACKSIGAELGINGGAPGSRPTYIAIGHLTFDSVESFEKSFVPHTSAIMADIPNYTNSKPLIQISEITL
jgi:uncharacterized protein (TIGR02118 family)